MFKKNYRQDNGVAYLLLAPIVILLTIFVVIPFIYSLKVSFYNWSFYQPSVFVGFDNFKFVLEDDLFLNAVWVGIKFTLMVVPASMVISFLFANIIKGMKSRGASFVKTSIYIPTIISGIVASIIFVFIYDYMGGLANYILGWFGAEPRAWLADVKTALPSIAVPAIWLGFGLTTLIMLAGLHDIPESYYEAADLEGAGTWQKMWFITVPLMKNIVLYLTVTGFTASISQYELSLVMTGGGPLDKTTTPNLYILNHFRNDVMVGNSIAASLLLFVVLGSISAIIFKVLNSEKAIDG
ncbi:multiple sugar transport system permease protein/raffinose/stachyose/melibiose transport system permease protein [Paenibacillus taihuensis]|uniref:Multiple sugar transport system permease protein/raffinose/stachyose/melibiose transport system permease protein n=1 Tax=Paenibacillus taihuensis TaxID=1156355 RepID=A0A3D9QXR4_9BACL|nr:sugar ABC transporter permease [Paenibacillus taihuensis]REE69592.1 multiple sugar transport system permease protein/raffinose/stachyose/melibiose transport system permease protein [Paenibacillus taihuensis]